jgi:pSer/pThr/pTyr-binding forkhead associated (FHA) protein
MKSFLNACGFREPLRLVVEGPRPADAGPRPLAQPFAVIGRDPRADLVLDDLRVSRRHAYLQAVAGRVFWVDLESRTGTCDEAGTRKWGWLDPGGLIQVGPFAIRRAAGEAGPGRDEPDRESPLAVRSYGREPLPEVALEFLNGPSQATTWPMNRVMSLIGSAKGCKFRLTDPSVSAFHAGLLRTPSGLWVVDLRGDRGLTVDGEPVRFGPLADGDVLGIGRYRMRIRCREAPGRATAAGLPAPRPRGEIARRPAPEPAGGSAEVPAVYRGPGLPAPPPPFPVVASASGVELVSSDAAMLAARAQHPESGDSALLPLVNQFGMMQQQMFDQFQQAMGMLVQMFSTMHREQMDVIREELDRLHELTRELQELRDELTRAPSRATAPAAGPAPRPAPVPILPPATAGPARAPAASGGPAGPPGEAPAPVPPAGPRPDRALHGAGLGPVGEPEAADAPRDAVAWIHQRIAAIQQERETRWQKIVKLLPGMS